MAAGVDYSSGHPGGAALKAAGKSFAARYVSHTASKNITAAEADDLAAHGVSTVLVWETTNNRAGAGRAAGITDAHDALTQATAAGMPSSRPLYFAVDWDANPSVVVAYFQGVASVLGIARTGAYGGYKVISYLLDHKLVTWAWQTAAWSAGKWDSRAHIRQPATTVHINGVSCDNDTSMTTDYGQWMPGKTPEVTPVTLGTADLKALINTDGILSAPPDAADIKTNKYWTWASHITGTTNAARAASTNTSKLITQVTALQKQVDALTAQVSALTDPAGFVAQVAAGLAQLQVTVTTKS